MARGDSALENLDREIQELAARLQTHAVEVVIKGVIPAEVMLDDEIWTMRFSGVLFDTGGLVICHGRALLKASEIVVRKNGREFPAQLLGHDSETGLAALLVSRDLAATCPEGARQQPRPGSLLAICGGSSGGAFGLSVTRGYGAVRTRDTTLDSVVVIQRQRSGIEAGALVANASGEMVGILMQGGSLAESEDGLSPSRLFSRFFERSGRSPWSQVEGGGREGAAFCFVLPLPKIREAVSRIRRASQSNRGWLGIQVQPLPEEDLAEGGIQSGLLVVGVDRFGPSGAGQLHVGDIILTCGGEAVSLELIAVEVRQNPGKKLALKILRDEEYREVMIVVGDRTRYDRRPHDTEEKP